MDFFNTETGKIDIEKIQLSIREQFENTLKKKMKITSEFSKEILEEYINHVVESFIEDIQLMKASSSLFVVDLKAKISTVCDYIMSVEKVEKRFNNEKN